MKAMMDLKIIKNLEDNDIFIYQDGYWTNVNKEEFLHSLLIDVKNLKGRCEKLEYDCVELRKLVRELRGEDNEEGN